MTLGPRYRVVFWVLVAVIWSFCAVQRVMHESNRALRASNAAFNEGKLRDAFEAAQRASSAWVPGAQSTLQASVRLRAIAVGSEATGRRRTALLAWSGIAATQLERGRVGFLGLPNPGEAAQHIEDLLPTRRGDTREVGFSPKGRAVAAVVGISQPTPGLAPAFFLVAIVLATLVLFWNAAAIGLAWKRVVLSRFLRWVLLAAAAGFWCIGWVVV